jgi:AraC family transcriptional regulator
LDDLSIELHISKFHMHRVFKQEFGQNIYQTIKSIRLQKASSLLLTNQNSTITSIANMCGYGSQAAFMRVFEQQYHMTPKQWRKGGYKEYTHKIINASPNLSSVCMDFSNLEPRIVKIPAFNAYYIRHQGYDKTIKHTWQKLQAWILCHDIKNYEQIGIHHDNPTITSLNQCRYNACVITKQEIPNASLPVLSIPQGVYAQFDFEGKYGDILHFMNWVYFKWLIKSGYETTTNPSFVVYKKNHFLQESEEFSVSYYIPIAV